MHETENLDWEMILERANMPPRQTDLRPVIAGIVICSLAGILGATWIIEFAKEISEVSALVLQPPTTFALQFASAGMGALLGTGIGYSVERYIAEGHI